MSHSITLPVTAMLALAGAGIGIHLGKSAIAEINPAYFVDPERGTRFHADLVAYRTASSPAVQASAIRDAGGAPLYHGCIGCRTYPEEYYPIHEASLGKPREGWAEMSEEVIEPPADDVMASEADDEMADIERYARYPVTTEEAQRQLAMAEPDSAVSGEAEAGGY